MNQQPTKKKHRHKKHKSQDTERSKEGVQSNLGGFLDFARYFIKNLHAVMDKPENSILPYPQ